MKFTVETAKLPMGVLAVATPTADGLRIVLDRKVEIDDIEAAKAWRHRAVNAIAAKLADAANCAFEMDGTHEPRAFVVTEDGQVVESDLIGRFSAALAA